eukprot:CAMPEP_0202766912 /NCGR_PEP_ID=MMETSP1388-20130828/31569_1 /ASSEMBLY_ACC=CAM_ASM_000864 /TAXON_ID=37098 /ORGANISM="Isochrysis sp, Strain CCMP1244" /LENGTH=376 /DNA_ID=CAMNT_0049435571 /DNA_START=12 /DNA_END=1142 /DNA_ORIENTATION=+
MSNTTRENEWARSVKILSTATLILAIVTFISITTATITSILAWRISSRLADNLDDLTELQMLRDGRAGEAGWPDLMSSAETFNSVAHSHSGPQDARAGPAPNGSFPVHPSMTGTAVDGAFVANHFPEMEKDGVYAFFLLQGVNETEAEWLRLEPARSGNLSGRQLGRGGHGPFLDYHNNGNYFVGFQIPLHSNRFGLRGNIFRRSARWGHDAGGCGINVWRAVVSGEQCLTASYYQSPVQFFYNGRSILPQSNVEVRGSNRPNWYGRWEGDIKTSSKWANHKIVQIDSGTAKVATETKQEVRSVASRVGGIFGRRLSEDADAAPTSLGKYAHSVSVEESTDGHAGLTWNMPDIVDEVGTELWLCNGASGVCFTPKQ